MNKIIQLLILQTIQLYIFAVGVAYLLCLFAAVEFSFVYSTTIFGAIIIGFIFFGTPVKDTGDLNEN